MKHPLDNANSSDSEAPPPIKKAKLEALEAILDEFGPITKVSFKPFECEAPRLAKATLPPDFPPTVEPYDYFALFFTPDLLKVITSNTNRYASLQRIQVKQERARQWYDLVVEECWVFIGVLIYMGVHEEPRINMYWNTDKTRGPIHTISTHITLNRYEEIKRYCHISNPEDDERLGRHLPTNTIWWYKVEPLASQLQASCQKYYSPSSEVSIDELMVRCFGR
ncbi:hypothetical protein DL98DRAFT_279450 [Cadophora sp. DSE1049]|nr:hypothetical protein DL98DRAFT_279450 [Cadophora sp. DSE1049]